VKTVMNVRSEAFSATKFDEVFSGYQFPDDDDDDDDDDDRDDPRNVGFI